MMKEVKATTLEGQISRHEASTDVNLWNCYDRWSGAKERAYEYCTKLMYDLDGWNFKIISYNTFQFTVGFYFYNKELHNVCFAYITRDYDRFCQLEDYDGYIPVQCV